MTIGLIIVLFFVTGMLLSAITSAPRSDEEGQPDTPGVEEVPVSTEPDAVILTPAVGHESIAA
jgi:hypothetical protein